MQTIKLETNKEEWARGRNGVFKPACIDMWATLGRRNKLALSVSSSRSGKTDPIMIILNKKNWARVLVALGEELGK